MCIRAAERKIGRWREEETHESMSVEFQAYGRPLEMVTEFKYPGRVINASNTVYPVVVANIHKAQRKWACLSGILGCEGAYPRTSGKLYKAVVKASFLFGLDISVMAPSIGRDIGRFRHRVTLYLAGMKTKKDKVGRREYPPLDPDIAMVGL